MERGADQTKQREVIVAEHVDKSFGGRPVLIDINLTLNERENLVILGQSGMGKSVLIKCIVGLIRIDQGHIYVMGDDIVQLRKKQLDQVRRKIGFSFQGSALYDSMSVAENLEFPLRRNLGLSDRKQLAEKVEEALEDVGLLDTRNKMPSELSGACANALALPGRSS